MGGVSGGERVRGRLHGRRPPRRSVSSFTSGDLCEGGDPWRWRRGRGGAITEPDGAAQHPLQGSEPRRRRLVQVPVVAARTGTSPRRGSASEKAPANHRRGGVDVHLALKHSWSSFSPNIRLVILRLLLLLLLIVVIIIFLNNRKQGRKEKKEPNRRQTFDNTSDETGQSLYTGTNQS